METARHHPYLSFNEMGPASLTGLLNGLNCDKTMILRILDVKRNILGRWEEHGSPELGNGLLMLLLLLDSHENS